MPELKYIADEADEFRHRCTVEIAKTVGELDEALLNLKFGRSLSTETVDQIGMVCSSSMSLASLARVRLCVQQGHGSMLQATQMPEHSELDPGEVDRAIFFNLDVIPQPVGRAGGPSMSKDVEVTAEGPVSGGGLRGVYRVKCLITRQ